MRFLRNKTTIIWMVLIWAIAQLLAGKDLYAGESGMPHMRYVLEARVFFIAGIGYLFYKNYKPARWLFMVYVGLMGIGGIGLGIILVSAGQFDYLLPLSFCIGTYFIYSAICIHRYY